jgi:hypothetical protein
VTRELSVEADLTLTVPAGEIRVRGYGDVVVVEAPSLAAARDLFDGTATLPLDRLTGEIESAAVDIDIRVRGRSVARIGPDVSPGPLSRAVGAAPARISVGGAILAALRALG